jgi:N-acetylglutamate synthase/N-acetylornithine aminotransferase
MADFNDIKRKIKETAGVIADVSVDLYKKAEEKSKTVAKSAKLQSEILTEKSNIKRLYIEIGKTYYETHRLFPEPELEQACAEITAAQERIEEKKAVLEDLKSGGVEIEIDVEIEEDDDEAEETDETEE